LEEHQLILDDDAGEILGGHEPIIYPDCVSLQRFTRTQIGSLYSNNLREKDFCNDFAEKEKEKNPMEVDHLGVASGESEVEAGARGKVEGGISGSQWGGFRSSAGGMLASTQRRVFLLGAEWGGLNRGCVSGTRRHFSHPPIFFIHSLHIS
jgi:hypothetical protein